MALCHQFDTRRLICVRDIVDTHTLATLLAQAMGARRHTERSYIPAHKKGGTLSYEAVHRHAPACLALYHSAQLRAWMSRIIGTPVYPTAHYDQSSCSVLYYDRQGDHIGWHFDHNFYRGRHFTVLLSLANRAMQPGLDIENGLSDGMLQRRYAGRVYDVPTPANTLVLFEGACVAHRATAIGSDQERIMLSMTFSTDPRIDSWKEGIRRVKELAYFGPRVLFD